ncbi:MAG: hypothetical protein IJP90_11985 [Treponema sp.]|nr:hypothetical protein [Treponema sp.]
MSTNLSKQKREDLLGKIEQIRAFLNKSIYDENACKLTGYLNELTTEINGQKYGFVFEEHKEAIDEKLENHLPVRSVIQSGFRLWKRDCGLHDFFVDDSPLFYCLQGL